MVSKNWKEELMRFTLNDDEKRVLREGASSDRDAYLMKYLQKRWKAIYVDTMEMYSDDDECPGCLE